MPNNTQQYMQEDKGTTNVAYVVYILYLAIFVPALPVLGIIFAYIFENDARDLLKTHYQYLIRTFWIGLLYFSISSLLVFLIIGLFLLPLCLIWWFIRNVKGLKSLIREEPIPNPKTWLF